MLSAPERCQGGGHEFAQVRAILREGGDAYLDLCYAEDSTADVDLNLVMKGDESIIEVQATAEGQAFDRAQLDDMLELGRKGVFELFDLQSKALADG